MLHFGGSGVVHRGITTNTVRSSAVARYMASNGNVMPYGQSSATTNNYRYSFKKRRFTTAGSNVRLTYCNFWVGNGFETNGDFAFTIQAGLLDTVTGVYYPASFAGSATATVTAGSYQTGLCAMTAVAGRDYIECNLVVGPASSVAYLYSHPAVAYRDEGFVEGTSASGVYNLATGAGIGRLAAGTAVLTTNTVSSITINNGGSQYGAFGLAYFVANEAGGKDADYYTTTDGSAVNGAGQNNAGSGFVTAPQAFLNNSYAKDTAIYAASICTVEASTAPVSGVICGDSIARGYTSSDAYGDSKGNFGIIERAFNSQFGILNLSIAGMTAAGFAATKQYAAITGSGVTINYCLIETGINDVTAGTTASDIMTANKVIADYWRAKGAKIQFATLLPSTTGTFTGDPNANQTANTGAGSSGVHTDYNAAVRSGSDSRVVGDYPCLDISWTLEDRTYPWAWNGSAGIALTADGSHPRGWSDAPAAKTGTTYNFFPSRGIEYFVTNAVMPTLYPTGFALTDITKFKAIYDATKYTSLTFNSTTISTWSDSSGNGNNAAQGTALKQPLYVASGINGRPALRGRHDGSNLSVMQAPDAASMDCTTFEAFVLVKRVADTGATGQVFGKYDATTNKREWRIYFGSGSPGAAGAGTTRDGTAGTLVGSFNSSPALATGTAYLIGLRFDGTNQILSVNGTDIDTDAQTSLFNGTGLLDLFGRESTPAEGFAGDMTIAAFANAILTTTERAKTVAHCKFVGGIA